MWAEDATERGSFGFPSVIMLGIINKGRIPGGGRTIYDGGGEGENETLDPLWLAGDNELADRFDLREELLIEIQSTTDQFQFVKDEVNVVIHECIESVLGSETWDGNKQEQWNNRIMECILEKMCKLKKPYKYIVQCTTVQRTGCIIDVANACYWDSESDGSCTIRWESPHIYAIVSVFGIFI